MSHGLDAYRQVQAEQQRESLIMGHLSLVRHIVGRLISKLPNGVDKENLEAAGILGLVEAANKFDAARGIQFQTFAYPRIQGAILDELRRNCPVPQAILERIARLREIHKLFPPPVTIEQLATASGMTEAEVLDTMNAMRLTRMASFENLTKPSELLLSPFEEAPDRLVELHELKTLLSEAISKLPEQKRIVVTLYYFEDLRLKEIGKVLNLSEARISRILDETRYVLGEYLRARLKD